MATNDDSRHMLELTWARELTLKQSQAEQDHWAQMKIAHRVAVNKNKFLIVWKATADGQAEVINSLKLVRMDSSLDQGMRLLFLDQVGSMVWVDHTPRAFAGTDVFVWLPFFNNVKYGPNHYNEQTWGIRLAINMKMRSHPDYWVHGHTYLTELPEFRARFPRFAETKF